MKSPLHSIRWRVQLWHALFLLLALAALCVAVFQMQRVADLQRVDRELAAREREVLFGLSVLTAGRPVPPQEVFDRLRRGEIGLPPGLAAQFQGTSPGYLYFSLRGSDDQVLLQTENAPPDAATLPPPAAGMVEETRSVANRRELLRSAEFGLRLVVGRDLTPELEQWRRLAWSLAVAGLGIWLLGLLGGWWIAGRATRPIQAISLTARRIAAGNLHERIGVADGAGELRELSEVLNRTFDRLREALEQQRRFTADAAHELRTPVAILTAELQRSLKRERSVEEYRTSLQHCSEATARMRRLVEDLLQLARDEAGGRQPEPCDLAELAAHAVQLFAPLAAEKGIELRCVGGPAPCLGNPAALLTAVSNLVGNAIQHHHRAGGAVTVTTSSAASTAVLSVRDDGPGIAADDLPHIFERFYRADRSRTTSTQQHTGLGLAIVQAVARAHGGEVRCVSELGHGASFILSVPSSAPAASG